MHAKLAFILSAILAIAFWRILPHPANVTPVMATALFCGSYLADKKLAILLPLLAMVVSDIFIGFHGIMLFVYAGVATTAIVGIVFLQHKRHAVNIVAATVGCSILFFILTNFGAWLMSGGFYPKTFEGLMQAYVAGIPFYRNSLLGDLFFVGLLFGGYHFILHMLFKSTTQTTS